MKPPRSHFLGSFRVGADFFERRSALGASDGPAPRGVVDAITDLQSPYLDVGAVDPGVAAFFEDTAGLDLLIRSTWHFPFSLIWPLLRPVMRLVGQFVLPRREGRVATKVLAIDRALDGRSDARGVVRTYDDGSVMQVVSYATWESRGTRYMSAAFPMPWSCVLGILRLDGIGDGAVELTSTSRAGDDARVWLALGPLLVPAPFSEQITLFPPKTARVLKALDVTVRPDAVAVGVHEQRLFGVRFATHHYWFSPARPDRAPRPKT